MPRSDIPEPWLTAMENAGLYSLNDLGRRANVATTTVAALVYGRRQSDERTIQAVADALRLPVTTIREWADTALGLEQPFELPAEARRLNRRQREAVVEIVRAMLEPVSQPESPASSDESDVPATPEPKQSDYSLAARRGPSDGRRQRAQQDADAES